MCLSVKTRKVSPGQAPSALKKNLGKLYLTQVYLSSTAKVLGNIMNTAERVSYFMKHYTPKTIYEHGIILLHAELREKLGLKPGAEVAFASEGDAIVLQKVGGESTLSKFHTRKVNSFGRLYIPYELRKIKKWKPGDKLSVCCTDDGRVILELLHTHY